MWLYVITFTKERKHLKVVCKRALVQTANYMYIDGRSMKLQHTPSNYIFYCTQPILTASESRQHESIDAV